MELPMTTPEKIGKYEVTGVLGRGGMGIVYRARDPRLNRVVAIKTLTEGFTGSDDMLQRFYHEATHTGALRHPNIVVVFDAGDQDGMPYIVMEYVEGDPLDALLREGRELPVELRLSIVEQLCLALAYAHRNGVIHRDIKPANVILQKDGTAKLVDFGIARAEHVLLDRNLTNTGTLIGTPAYMAPERIHGAPVDGRCDIFSAGVLLYQLIAGRLPFDAEFPAIIDQILNAEPVPLSALAPGCPVELDAVISRALAKKPEQRYEDASLMAFDLRAILETVRHTRVVELLEQAQAQCKEHAYQAAQESLRQLGHLDSKHVEAKRLLAKVEQQLAEQGKERRAAELARLAQQAAAERDWDGALAFLNEAVALQPANAALAALLQSTHHGKQTRDQVFQLLSHTRAAREAGDLERARTHVELAHELDPLDSQVVAMCRAVQRELAEKARQEELARILKQAEAALSERRFDQAALLVKEVESIASGSPELVRFKDRLAAAMAEERRRMVVRRLEDAAPLAVTVERLRATLVEIDEALNEFATDPTLLLLKLQIAPRLQQVEDEAFVRDAARLAQTLSSEEALAHIRRALLRVPGNAQLLGLESAIADRLARQAREKCLADDLRQARVAIEDHLYLEAARILERCESQGYSSPESRKLLEFAKSAASERVSQELIERTHSRAAQLLEAEDYGRAVRLLTSALQKIDEPVLRRRLDEANQRQKAVEQVAGQVLETASRLMELELWEEAARLIAGQAAGVRMLPAVKAARERVSEAQNAEEAWCERLGTLYAQLSTSNGIDELKAFLEEAAQPGEMPWHAEGRNHLRQRAEAIAAERMSGALTAAREAAARDDARAADGFLAEAAPWVSLCAAPVREQFENLRGELAEMRKVLRFRRVKRR